jgi:hypothetical protein
MGPVELLLGATTQPPLKCAMLDPNVIISVKLRIIEIAFDRGRFVGPTVMLQLGRFE